MFGTDHYARIIVEHRPAQLREEAAVQRLIRSSDRADRRSRRGRRPGWLTGPGRHAAAH